MLARIIVTLLIIGAALIVERLLSASITRIVEARQIRRVRGDLVNRISRLTVGVVLLILLISIWGFNTDNIWIFMTGVLGAIAIGFFAMWSLLSNVVAGLMLFMSDPFRIDDEIVLLPDNVQGTVIDIKVLFVVVQDQEGHTLHIPNSLFFQKVLKKIAPQKHSEHVGG